MTLWQMFCERRLHSVYETTAGIYHEPEFKQDVSRGSPLDICEYLFLKSISLCQLSVSSPEGKTMKISTTLMDGQMSTLSILPPVFAIAAVALEEGRKEGEAESRKWGGPLFSRAKFEDPKFLVQRYAAPTAGEYEQSFSFHSLPIFFLRPHFTVADHLPAWAKRFGDPAEGELLIDHFAGWSLVLSDEAMEEWRPYLDGKSPLENEWLMVSAPTNTGRPRERDAAAAAFMKIYPNGTALSWKEVLRELELREGVAVSRDTLKRGLIDAGIDAKTGSKLA